MFPKENGAPALRPQGPDRTKLNAAKSIELSPASQAESRPSAAVFETASAVSMDEGAIHVSMAWHYCESALLYANIGDARGYLYAISSLVASAIRAGDEAVQLRKIRADFRSAEAERGSAAAQQEGAP
jgi:hypothetical protein